MEQFIIVREYEFTTPLVVVQETREQAEANFMLNFGGVTRVTLYLSVRDTLGYNIPVELKMRECVMNTAN